MGNGTNALLRDKRHGDYQLMLLVYFRATGYLLGVPVLHLPPGLLSTCNNPIAADNYSPSRYGCYLFFHKTAHKQKFPGTA